MDALSVAPLHIRMLFIYLFIICGLFNDAVNRSVYIASNGRMISE
jgi:hypothetical protein